MVQAVPDVPVGCARGASPGGGEEDRAARAGPREQGPDLWHRVPDLLLVLSRRQRQHHDVLQETHVLRVLPADQAAQEAHQVWSF